MEIITFDSYLFFFSRSIFWSSAYFLLPVIFLRLILKGRPKNEMVNMQVTGNLVIGLTITLYFIQLVWELLNAWYGHTDKEWFAFKHGDGSNFRTYWTIEICTLIIGLIFLAGHLRKSWIASLIVIILLNIEYITIWMTNLFRDSLPSSWTASYGTAWHEKVVYGLVSFVSFIITYIFLYVRKTLPFQSIFIKRATN